ncbi:MAG: D-glyceraldehyde dehydrogenase [Candidatus Thermoplasmatota archaeon]|nr:D-glyceraldehyde dehydrogenase [Candidatus Thermoplasmatota archaeon]
MKNYIDGQWVDSSNGKTIDKLNPSTGELLDKFPASTTDDVDRAIDAAEASYEAWYALGSVERGRIIRETGDRIKAARKELEEILIRECGKVKVQAAEEVDGVLDQVYYYSEFARKITGDIVEGTTSHRKIFQYKIPHGVVIALTPWNFPAAMVARKLAPALLTGNSVVLKPSSDTPLTAEWIVRKFVEAGIPRGVLNLITGKGSEIGDYIVSHKKVGLVTMTGSTETGQRIIQNTAKNMAKTILELGGKAPFIIWKDADLENAARALIWAKFWNAGQSCIAAERVYVHSDVKKKFMDIFLKMTSEIRVGDPTTSVMGPLINRGAVETMESFMSKARQEKLNIVAGGKIPDMSGPLKNGFFFEPTVIDNVPQESPLFQEEIFGPIVGIHEVSDKETMFRLANDSRYGLASYLFTSDMNLVYEASERIRFGEIYVNMPGPEASQGYHTGFRMTGQAGEGSKYGIEEYLKIKNVYVDYSGNKLRIGTVPGF